ncbi:MAG: hypothetical protein QOJ80_207 [Mycobacterium sp.]|jgi:hypothetical protein|nr:hypothetical protein [Mycobacterium sp.]
MKRIRYTAAAVAVIGGVVAGAVSSPTASAVTAGQLSGTYSVAPYGDLVHIASDCAQCDAVASGAVGSKTLHWTGAGWENVSTDQCGPVTGTLVPAVVANGFVQEVSFTSAGGCAGALTTAWSRIGP